MFSPYVSYINVFFMKKLYFIYGPMGCSKSANLLMKAYAFEKNNIPVMLIKPSVDTRDGKTIIKSRIGLEHEAYVWDKDKPNELWSLIVEFMSKGRKYPEWLLVDESQFLTPEQVDKLAWVVDELQLANIMCYGLRTDFRSQLFPGSRRLFEIADSIEELKLTCECGRKAIINARVDGRNKIILDGNQIELGGDEKYVSMCRKCYNRKINEQRLC